MDDGWVTHVFVFKGFQVFYLLFEFFCLKGT